MGRTSTFPLADKALDHKLEERLRAARKANESFESIARGLHLDGIAISGETVRQWCRDLGIES